MVVATKVLCQPPSTTKQHEQHWGNIKHNNCSVGWKLHFVCLLFMKKAKNIRTYSKWMIKLCIQLFCCCFTVLFFFVGDYGILKFLVWKFLSNIVWNESWESLTSFFGIKIHILFYVRKIKSLFKISNIVGKPTFFN